MPRRRGREVDERAPAVGRVLAPLDEAVVLEVARQLARGRQRETGGLGDVSHCLRTLRADVREDAHVAATERRVARHELEQLRCRAPSRPEPAHHPPQLRSQFAQVVVIGYHQITIIESEGRR